MYVAWVSGLLNFARAAVTVVVTGAPSGGKANSSTETLHIDHNKDTFIVTVITFI